MRIFTLTIAVGLVCSVTDTGRTEQVEATGNTVALASAEPRLLNPLRSILGTARKSTPPQPRASDAGQSTEKDSSGRGGDAAAAGAEQVPGQPHPKFTRHTSATDKFRPVGTKQKTTVARAESAATTAPSARAPTVSGITRSDARPIIALVTDTPVYSDTISGTLVVVADQPIQHHRSCRRQSCRGECCYNGVRPASSCGQAPGNRSCSPPPSGGPQPGPGPVLDWQQDGLATGWLFGDTRPMGVTVGGWLAQSFTANPSHPSDRHNGPVTFVDRANDYQLNQLYLYFDRPTRTDDRLLDVGGRLDLLYGTDARFTLAKGLDDNIVSDSASRFYKMSFPQLYAEAAIGNLAVQMGRFYTILGYEAVPAKDNFFISHSYSLQYGEPRTNTGMLARYNGPGGLTWAAGFTRGWDNWEDNNGKLDVIGGMSWASRDGRRALSAAVTSGPQDDLGLNDRTLTTVVIEQAIGSWINYVFQTDIGYENNGGANNQGAEWYSFVNYLIFDINPCWSLGVRQEWFSDDDGILVYSPQDGATEPALAGHWQEIALGVNYRPRDSWVVRSEARWDWVGQLVPAAGGPYDGGNGRSQFIWATDLIIGF